MRLLLVFVLVACVVAVSCLPSDNKDDDTEEKINSGEVFQKVDEDEEDSKIEQNAEAEEEAEELEEEKEEAHEELVELLLETNALRPTSSSTVRPAPTVAAYRPTKPTVAVRPNRPVISFRPTAPTVVLRPTPSYIGVIRPPTSSRPPITLGSIPTSVVGIGAPIQVLGYNPFLPASGSYPVSHSPTPVTSGAASGLGGFLVSSGVGSYPSSTGLSSSFIPRPITSSIAGGYPSVGSGISSYPVPSGISTYPAGTGPVNYPFGSFSVTSRPGSYPASSGIVSYPINSGGSSYPYGSGVSNYPVGSGVSSYPVGSGVSVPAVPPAFTSPSIHTGLNRPTITPGFGISSMNPFLGTLVNKPTYPSHTSNIGQSVYAPTHSIGLPPSLSFFAPPTSSSTVGITESQEVGSASFQPSFESVPVVTTTPTEHVAVVNSSPSGVGTTGTTPEIGISSNAPEVQGIPLPSSVVSHQQSLPSVGVQSQIISSIPAQGQNVQYPQGQYQPLQQYQHSQQHQLGQHQQGQQLQQVQQPQQVQLPQQIQQPHQVQQLPQVQQHSQGQAVWTGGVSNYAAHGNQQHPIGAHRQPAFPGVGYSSQGGQHSGNNYHPTNSQSGNYWYPPSAHGPQQGPIGGPALFPEGYASNTQSSPLSDRPSFPFPANVYITNHQYDDEFFDAIQEFHKDQEEEDEEEEERRKVKLDSPKSVNSIPSRLVTRYEINTVSL